jgi:tRNA G10  N-methylase Trm11
MPQYLVKLAQVHESFRRAELNTLAELASIDIKFDFNSEDVRCKRKGYGMKLMRSAVLVPPRGRQIDR